MKSLGVGFKPYYNWNTFNTMFTVIIELKGFGRVLNLIITGIPSIQQTSTVLGKLYSEVLNLIITGIPSILLMQLCET